MSELVKKNLIFKEHRVLKLDEEERLHQCAAQWSDRCLHCEYGFDEIKGAVLAASTDSTETKNDLILKIKECLYKLEG
jgi:hypothetical protein